jgi:F5/8 type C domain
MDRNGQADWKGWVISSREHINPDTSALKGFAIGMKIPPLSKQGLISNLGVFKNTSASESHPQTSSFVDNGGTGFSDLDYGTVTAYAMGIRFFPTSAEPEPGEDPLAHCNKPLKLYDGGSSGDRASYPSTNAIDGDSTTKWWSASTTTIPWILIVLDPQAPICRADITWGDDKPYHFKISVSTNSTTYTDVSAQEFIRTGISTTESYTFPAVQALYIKITITQSAPVQISEIRMFSNQTK